MPTYRSITIKLHSQFNIDAFPEYIPRRQSYYTERGITSPVPPHLDEKKSTCSVYVPVFPNSQFWISYAVAPPVPEDQLFLFKLYINGAHVVSWSAGKEDKWKGKTMFALFEVQDKEGRRRVERRVLCFTAPDGRDGNWGDVDDAFDEEACLEVRVHRALGRKRVEREMDEYRMTEHGKCERGISLASAGLAGSEQPKRFYKYALIDAVDKPFTTFRFYYRTREQIRELGVSKEGISAGGEANELSIIEPYDADGDHTSEAEGSKEVAQQSLEDVFQSSHDGADDDRSSLVETYIPTGSPGKRSNASGKHSNEHERAPSRLGASHSSYRLSVPPSCKFEPPEPSSRPLPQMPQKYDPAPVLDTGYRPHPVFPIDDWETRTPSPVQSLRETISTPTIQRKKGLTPTGWLNAITGTWRRRGTRSNEDGSRAASRSDSRGGR